MEETASDLQAQIDRLSSTIRQWLETRDQLEPMQVRLSEVTERCAEILNRWAVTDERHARAVSEVETRLDEWAAIENRLQQESVQRIKQLEQAIEHEWKALRQVHEAPAQQLRDQAAALGETCVAAANLALRGFERAEARFVALETDLHERLGQLSRDVQAAVAEVRSEPIRRALNAPVEPFPLDGVMRIHEELRDGDDVAPADPPPRRLADRPAAHVLADSDPLPVDAIAPTYDIPVSPSPAAALPAPEVSRRFAVLLAAAVIGALVFAGVYIERRIGVRLDSATSRAAAAEQQAKATSDLAAQQIAAARADADRQIAEARRVAANAEIVTTVLAAPDLIRFNLVGSGDVSRAYAQVSWSRTRGMLVSGSRLPPPADGGTYQLWLLTESDPVSVGALVPDPSGRVTFATDDATIVPRRVTGASVTLESAAGATSPSGIVVLSRAQQQTPQQTPRPWP